MRLFNLDLHISVIADVKNIFEKIFPFVKIYDSCLSGHSWVFNKNKANIDIVNAKTWKLINKNMVKKFNDKYDNFLSNFNGFIVAYPCVFSLLFEKYNKPIFIVNAVRYEMPYCWTKNLSDWEYLNEKLNEMNKKGLLITVSNNIADVEYLKMATGIDSVHIPSLCLYTNECYNPTKPEILLQGYNNNLSNYLKIENIVNKTEALPSPYKWKDMYEYKAIVIFPYEISTMTIFELYSANMPMFFPSKHYLKQLLKNNTIMFYGPYTKDIYPNNLEQALGNNWIEFWIEKADYYDENNMKYIIYFENEQDLENKIKTMNLNSVSNNMKEWNKIRQQNVYSSWKNVSKNFIK